jgi:hypothetical protein
VDFVNFAFDSFKNWKIWPSCWTLFFMQTPVLWPETVLIQDWFYTEITNSSTGWKCAVKYWNICLVQRVMHFKVVAIFRRPGLVPAQQERITDKLSYIKSWADSVAWSVQRLGEGWTAGAWTPLEAKDFLFSISVQTGPRAHPGSYTMGTGSLPGVKQPGRGVDHPLHLAPRLK